MKILLLSISLLWLFNNSYCQVTADNDPALDFKKDLAERVIFTDVQFSIQPPLHFSQPDSGFVGFIHPGVGASIAIAPIPYRSYKNVSEEFENKDFKSSNSELIDSKTITLENGKEAFLYTVRFIIQEKEVERLVLITGTDKKTYMVFANYPVLIAPIISPVINASFKTILFD